MYFSKRTPAAQHHCFHRPAQNSGGAHAETPHQESTPAAILALNTTAGVSGPAKRGDFDQLIQRTNPSRSSLGRAGFTLTEIAVAMGIFSFALVSLLGMLSVGLKNSRKAAIQTSASNVLSAISSDIQSSTSTYKVVGSVRTYTFTSPILGIIATVGPDKNNTGPTEQTALVSGGTLYVRESCTPVANVDTVSPLEKIYRLELSPAAQGTPAIRVRVVWPHKQSPGSREEGSLETLVPLPFF